MGCLITNVPFAATPPVGSELVAALRQHTGEAVTLDLDLLSCPEISTSDSYVAFLNVKINGWELWDMNSRTGYLWFVALIVLQRLGGTFTSQIPSWAFKPWHQAKQEQKHWFVRRYTFAEARRLGVA